MLLLELPTTEDILVQVEKLSVEIWTVPLQFVFESLVVTEFVIIPCENCNEIDVVTSTLVSPSLGDIEVIIGLIFPSTVSSSLE